MRKLLLGLALLSMSSVFFVACDKSEAPAEDAATTEDADVLEPVKTDDAVTDAEAEADAEVKVEVKVEAEEK